MIDLMAGIDLTVAVLGVVVWVAGFAVLAVLWR
jgi:hypothetical protein